VLIPSPEIQDGRAALERLLKQTRSVRAAVAFVTLSGVELLGECLGKARELEHVTIVARGAPVTERDALLALRDDLNAEVSVLADDAFHPKLWLFERVDATLGVLTGSGNLTAGGMIGNREQFEVLEFEDPDLIAAHQRRFVELTADAIPLDRFVESIAWKTWVGQDRKREELENHLREMTREITESPAEDREPDKELLMNDLWAIHNETKAARLPKLEGSGIYDPSGFRLELEGHRGNGQPVSIACRLCRAETDGFRTIMKANRPDLTVEYLITNPQKRYHTLIPPDIREASERRLRDYLSTVES
jgi:HKD family nuclease